MQNQCLLRLGCGSGFGIKEWVRTLPLGPVLTLIQQSQPCNRTVAGTGGRTQVDDRPRTVGEPDGVVGRKRWQPCHGRIGIALSQHGQEVVSVRRSGFLLAACLLGVTTRKSSRKTPCATTVEGPHHADVVTAPRRNGKEARGLAQYGSLNQNHRDD